MPSPESEDDTRLAPEGPATAPAREDEPAWPPAEAQPRESSPPPAPDSGLAEPTTSSAVAAATDEPILTEPEEPEDAKDAKLDVPAAEPQQEMALSESTLHWLVDGEQAIDPVTNEPGTAPHYDPRAPVAGRKRTVAVIGGAAILALVVAVVLHGQAARNRPTGDAPAANTEPAAVLTERAEAALVQGRAGEAMELAHLAISSDPRFSDAYIVVGKIQHESGRLLESRDAYRKYLELAPIGTHAEEARAALTALPP